MPNTLKKPIPVILASNALARLWPISSAAKSYALHQQRDGLSPLQKMLQAIESTNAYAAPIIMLQEGALRTAQLQIEAVYKGETSIIATTPSVTSGMLCALAAVQIASKSANANVVYLPATLTATNAVDLTRYLKLFATTTNQREIVEEGQICFAAATGQADSAQFNFILKHRPTRSGLADVASIQIIQKADLEHENMGGDDSRYTNPIGPAIVRANTISKLLAKHAPTILQACNYAIDTSEKCGNVLRPNDHFMTLCPPATLADIVASSPEQTKVLTCGTDLTVVRDWSNPLAQAPDDAPIVIQTVGSTVAKTITHADRILVIGKGGESQVKIPKSQSFGERESSISGSYCVEHHSHSAVWRHALTPDETKPNECHFHRTENITIIAGKGIAYVDDQEMDLTAGISIHLPPGTCHEIQNTGTEPLIYFEMRMGQMYDDDDRLYIPRDKQNRKTA